MPHARRAPRLLMRTADCGSASGVLVARALAVLNSEERAAIEAFANDMRALRAARATGVRHAAPRRAAPRRTGCGSMCALSSSGACPTWAVCVRDANNNNTDTVTEMCVLRARRSRRRADVVANAQSSHNGAVVSAVVVVVVVVVVAAV